MVKEKRGPMSSEKDGSKEVRLWNFLDVLCLKSPLDLTFLDFK